MYDDDLFNMLNSYTATETDEKTYQDTQTSPQTFQPFESIKSPYVDDYSTAQNFEEEKSYNYNSNSSERDYEETQTRQIQQMHTPTIKQSEKTVNLIKTREKIYISPRLKTAAAFCLTIFLALVFVVIYNFAWAANANAEFAAKQVAINEISQSINELKVEYNELTNQDSTNMGYVEKVEGENSFTISLSDFYTEPEIVQLPSNWFNDVCEFFSKLFA